MAMNKHFRVAGSLAERLEENGVRVPAVLRRAGLSPDLFASGRVLLTTQELFAFWHAIGEVSEDPAIALKLGTERQAQRFHPSGIAALASETFGAAMKHLSRYKQLTCPEEIIEDVAGGEWSIRFRWTEAPDVEPLVLVEYCFAWLQTLSRHGTGTKLSPKRLEMLQPRKHVRELERHFGCEIVSNASRNAMIFLEEDAATPFLTRNAELLDLLAPQLEEQLRQSRQESDAGGFVNLVRDAIQQRLTGQRPAMEDVARALHVSTRTLQRRLQESGSSYQRVLDEARHELARYYLGNSVLELNEAAYLLGYEDANSFVRAFRGWEGVPPGHWRESQRARLAN
ncbi:AraC-type DNA-binding protein [Bryocella elongata]|uniref:AraC-type DNA-binding protein n=2 Tax=Bryocella elongata TaxID=863522 RepID=A0A1H5TCC0_9BACT|nr:AraC-type DNA-binding protein [Bryocella elongata]